MKRIAILLLLSALALPVAAQDYQVPEIEISKDKVLVDGKPFFAHVVTAKQTLFSISKAYGVTVRDIIEANQKLDLEKRGLKIGDVLFIPDVQALPQEAAPAVQEQIEEQSQMDEPDMTAVPSHMKTAEDEAYMQEAAEADTLIDHRALFPGSRDYSFDTDPQRYADSVFYMNQIPERISVAVLLPFNASGTADSNSRDFYSGVLLAARDLGNAGLGIDLHTYDIGAGGDIKSSMLEDADVIIGPISREHVIDAVSLCPSNKCIISPLEPKNAALADSLQIVQAPSPSSEQARDAVRWALDEMEPGDSLVVVIESGKPLTDNISAILSELQSSGRRYSTISYGMLEGTRIQSSFLSHASNGGTTRFLLASENESFVNDAIRNMNVLAFKRHNVVLYATSRLRNFATVEAENLHNIRTHISATYHIDYSDADVQAFVLSYRALFGGEPNSFAFHGYDVMSCFTKMCATLGRGWFYRLPDNGWSGLQANFGFKDREGAGQVNTAVRRVIYTPDYQVVLQ